MLIEPRKPAVTSKDAININFGGDTNYYNTQLLLLQNPDLMKQVVVELGLYHEPALFDSDNKGVGQTFRSMFSSKKAEVVVPDALPVVTDVSTVSSSGPSKPILSDAEDALAGSYAARLVGGLTVEQRQGTNLVNINVRSTNPQLAARVADKVAEVFRIQDGERETAGAERAAADLTKSIEDLKNTIDSQQIDLMNMMRSSNLPLAEKGQELSATRLQNMSETWMSAMDDRRKLEARYNAAVQASSRGEGMNIPDLYENKIFQDTMRLNTERKAKLQDTIRDIEKQIQENETEKAELLVRYTPEYSKVKEKEQKIASLNAIKEKTQTEVSQIIDTDQRKMEKDAVNGALVALGSQLDAARKREGQVLASYNQEAAKANLDGQAQTRLTTLKREIDTNRNLLDTYTQRQKEQELAIASGRPDNIKIASNAVVPTAPVGPARTRNISVAFLMSLFAGVGLAFLLDYLDDSVKTSDDIGRHLGLPTLALIPHNSVTDKKRISLVSNNGNSVAPVNALATLGDRRSVTSEAYRHLRTSLLFSSAGKPPQTILITSSQPSEGKTTTAINTAITLAQADVDVVIIDCDLRRPRVHTYFDLENTHGLTNYLSGERNTENLIRTCRELPRLKVITSGPIPPNPAELLSSGEMKNLLQFLRGRYKHVIIDSPPAISFTDATILSTLVDGVVLVAMAGKSSTHLMRRFKQRLNNIGARMYGVVLNGIKTNSVEYEYYGSGYSNYYEHPDESSTPLMKETETVHRTNA